VKLKKFFIRKADDPMGALNDLSFLLIIYFLVIAGFNTNFGFLLNLPSPDKPRIVQKDDLIRLSLKSDGTIMYSENLISGAEMENLLVENLKVHPNLTVLLTIDPDTAYQSFVNAMEVVRKLDVENFSFSMKDSPQ